MQSVAILSSTEVPIKITQQKNPKNEQPKTI